MLISLTMYNINIFDLPENVKVSTESQIKDKVRMPDEHGYEFVRFGESAIQAFKHESVLGDIQILLKHYYTHGYSNYIPRLNNLEFKKAVLAFRCALDVWELIPISKVFTKDEIYFRSLQEGQSYTEFLKKCRSTTLRGLTSITESIIEEEYFFPDGYEGYDSIFHERNLIYWDDRSEVDDVKYAFMPYNGRVNNFQEIFSSFLESLRIENEAFNLELDTLGELKNTKMFDPVTRRTALMREFWTDEITLDSPYMAKRAVVFTEPGSTRDAGVGDPSTIAKVKTINKICRTILERCMHSASAPAETATGRMKRVLERNTYLHLDFKKYGLAFPRALQNIALQVIGHTYSIDVEPLIITDFFIEIDKEFYKTTRGLMLGWVDCLNELVVHAILWDLSYRQSFKFDWISFNDDVEISFNSSEIARVNRSEMTRSIVLATFNSYDILISISKTYASESSVFLEKYFRFKDKYGLNMEKRQLSCRSYARSMVTKYPWQAKLHFSVGHLVWPNEEVASRCIITSKTEFDDRERKSSLVVGGWYPNPDLILDKSLMDQPQKLLGLLTEIMKISIPEISTKPTLVSSNDRIQKEKVKIVTSSHEPDDGLQKFDMREVPYDINFEAEGIFDTAHIWVDQYHGRKGDYFASTWNTAVVKLRDQAKVFDPGIG